MDGNIPNVNQINPLNQNFVPPPMDAPHILNLPVQALHAGMMIQEYIVAKLARTVDVEFEVWRIIYNANSTILQMGMRPFDPALVQFLQDSINAIVNLVYWLY